MENRERPNYSRGKYSRPRLEDFLADTIPPISRIDTEIFFSRVTDDTLNCLRPEYGPLVLDIASGMGIDSCHLAKRGFKVISLEPMRAMVDYARKHNRKNGQYTMYVNGYAEEIPLRDGCVDQALCKGSLDHFIDPRAALDETRRVLKRGGRFVVATANYDSLSMYSIKLWHKWRYFRDGPPPPDAPRPPYEIPSDHVTRFNAKVLRDMVGEYFRIERIFGIGLLWGAPFLDLIWNRFSREKADKAINRLYDIGVHIPALADMTILDCVKV